LRDVSFVGILHVGLASLSLSWSCFGAFNWPNYLLTLGWGLRLKIWALVDPVVLLKIGRVAFIFFKICIFSVFWCRGEDHLSWSLEAIAWLDIRCLIWLTVVRLISLWVELTLDFRDHLNFRFGRKVLSDLLL
jgi:hypothetical protein